MKRQLTQPVRRLVARLLRPAFAALDARLEQLSARLERHTTNLSIDQRTEIGRIDERLTLDLAVMSEHLVGVERIARKVTHNASTTLTPASRLVIALPGEPLVLPLVGSSHVAAYESNGDGTWSLVPFADTSTLRLVVLSDQPTA